MKKWCMALMMLATSVVGMAQKDMTAVKDEEAFISSVKEKMMQVSSIQSDFKQVKHMAMMKKDIESSGNFYYSKTDKVCLDYAKPKKSKIVINGDKLLMEMGGIKDVRNISSNALMQEMTKVISSCMTGNLQELKANYQLEYWQNETNYLVKVSPKNASAKKMVDRIELVLLKSDFSVESMKMIETSRRQSATPDYTEYFFSNKKLNVSIPSSVFDVK
ncbi:MAG: outer membrane lipoprotein carrier protein LolA [Paludibacteraceae bacterium]|nr:outer membrane lipoprotein carrier protein LolA [Paludibacteraceae bacterium]MBR4840387.1 outer membrane lipoprotein carrier protein LolA [Paludibacteraceae bacterium]